MRKISSDKGKTGVSRRSVLKGTAAVAGVAAATQLSGGFPTVWSQDIKGPDPPLDRRAVVAFPASGKHGQ